MRRFNPTALLSRALPAIGSTAARRLSREEQIAEDVRLDVSRFTMELQRSMGRAFYDRTGRASVTAQRHIRRYRTLRYQHYQRQTPRRGRRRTLPRPAPEEMGRQR